MGKMNFTMIYDYITKYYPIGVKATNPEYFNYHGIKLLNELSSKKLESLRQNEWKSFIKRIKNKDLKISSIKDETLLDEPAYSASITLQKKKIEFGTFTREIRFHVSLIAPFYTVYGLDRVKLKLDKEEGIDFDPVVYVSPIYIYDSWFELLRNSIEESYTGYDFISFHHLSNRIDGLSIPGATLPYETNASIFQAFFTPEDITRYKVKGDTLYA
jgi:hypothetical protein